MSKPIVIACMIALFATSTCFADQLAWNSREICEESAMAIKRNSILISYCSLCDNEYVEIWLVKKVIVGTTAVHNLFQVNIFGKRMYKSKKAFQEKQYFEPVDYESIAHDDSSQWFLEGIDLAYIYVPTVNGSFLCLGKMMQYDCDVNVEIINLPSKIIDNINNYIEKKGENEMLERSKSDLE